MHPTAPLGTVLPKEALHGMKCRRPQRNLRPLKWSHETVLHPHCRVSKSMSCSPKPLLMASCRRHAFTSCHACDRDMRPERTRNMRTSVAGFSEVPLGDIAAALGLDGAGEVVQLDVIHELMVRVCCLAMPAVDFNADPAAWAAVTRE